MPALGQGLCTVPPSHTHPEPRRHRVWAGSRGLLVGHYQGGLVLLLGGWGCVSGSSNPVPSSLPANG